MSLIAPLRRLAFALVLGVSLPTLALAQDQAPTAGQEGAPAAAAAPVVDPAPVDPATVVATVDGIEITEGDVALAATDPALPLPGMDEARRREVLVGYLVDLKLAARAAAAASLDDGAEFERRLAYQRDKILLDTLLEQTVEEAITEEAARVLYEEMISSTPPQEEVRARHILVPTQEEAQAAVDRIAAGEEFAEVAADLSEDTRSAVAGGDLGFFTRDRMVAPFAEAAFALEPGAVSAPVQSQFGWHVIRVEERRERPVPTFEEMREQIDTFLARRAQQELILALRADASIEQPTPAPAEGETAPAPQ